MLIELHDARPTLDESAFVADNATLIGGVKVSPKASIWFGAVLRADVNTISIGRCTNIQDLCIIHVTKENKTSIGDNVTVGHGALIHACTVGNNCLIGMGSILMNGVEIGDNCIVGAGSLVTQGTKVPAGSLVVGSPARVKRPLTDDEIRRVTKSALDYYDYSKSYATASSHHPER